LEHPWELLWYQLKMKGNIKRKKGTKPRSTAGSVGGSAQRGTTGRRRRGRTRAWGIGGDQKGELFLGRRLAAGKSDTLGIVKVENEKRIKWKGFVARSRRGGILPDEHWGGYGTAFQVR